MGISPGSNLGTQDAFDLSAPGMHTATTPMNAIFQHLNASDGPWDLDCSTFSFNPDAGGTLYTHNNPPTASLGPPDTICRLGTPLSPPLGDDSSLNITFSSGTFTFYGVAYADCFLNANGNVTFGGPDGDFTESTTEMLANLPRIAAAWDDLNPSFGGAISVDEFAGKVFITWDDVPAYTTGSNTQCIIMDLVSGEIVLGYGTDNSSWNGSVSSRSVLCGISPGNGLGTLAGIDLDLPGVHPPSSALKAMFELFNIPGGPPWDLDGVHFCFVPDTPVTSYTHVR